MAFRPRPPMFLEAPISEAGHTSLDIIASQASHPRPVVADEQPPGVSNESCKLPPLRAHSPPEPPAFAEPSSKPFPLRVRRRTRPRTQNRSTRPESSSLSPDSDQASRQQDPNATKRRRVVRNPMATTLDKQLPGIFDKPRCWNWCHLGQIGCRFSKREVPDIPLAEVPILPNVMTGYAHRALTEGIWLPNGNEYGIRHLLESFGLRHTGTDTTPFECDRRATDTMVTDGIYTFNTESSLAFVTQLTLTNHGGDWCHQYHAGNKTEHPYVAASMISMAQQQVLNRRRRQSQREMTLARRAFGREDAPNPSGPGIYNPMGMSENPLEPYPVYLVLAPDTTGRALYFYAAEISPSFLDKFESSSSSCPCDQLIIARYHIPLWDASYFLQHFHILMTVAKQNNLFGRFGPPRLQGSNNAPIP